ncbi:MAG: hypothetical protein MZW92_13705 [Comamonadaceae bacterium]|nr:hypothetical protein [Comamonadaceae bacterium]
MFADAAGAAAGSTAPDDYDGTAPDPVRDGQGRPGHGYVQGIVPAGRQLHAGVHLQRRRDGRERCAGVLGGQGRHGARPASSPPA